MNIDLTKLVEGDIEPTLNKEIKELVVVTPQYMVYLDANLEIQWTIPNDVFNPPKHFGHVLNRVGILEAKSHFVTNGKQLSKIKRNIAEGIVRALEGGDEKLSDLILDEVEKDISARNKEKAWFWYYSSAFSLTTLSIVLFLAGWIYRVELMSIYGMTSFQVTLGALVGAAGALLSTLSRSNRLVTDANAGVFLHILEGASRVVAGLIGALLIALGIKAGLLFGAIEIQGSEFAALLVFCLIAGASERFIPSLITKVERETG